MKKKIKGHIKEKKENTEKKPRARWLRVVGKIAKWTGISLCCAVLLVTTICAVARVVNSGKTKIGTADGIQESVYIEVNGIQQFLYIRGNDASNPVLFFIHGGPGSPMAYTAYAWQTALENSYTVVHWDQRGSGRTYYENKNSDAQPPTIELLLSDMDAIVDYLCGRFGQSQVILMGHSWGTILGTQYIQRYPDKVGAYIGVGQVVSPRQGDIIAAKYAIEMARQAGSEDDAAQMQLYLDQYIAIEQIDSENIKMLANLRMLEARYLPDDGVVSGLPLLWLGLASPDMSWRDMKWFIHASGMDDTFFTANKTVLKECMAFDLYSMPDVYNVPVYFITGESDWTTPASLVQEYFGTVGVPQENMVVLSGTGHSPFIDQPERFCETVKILLG